MISETHHGASASVARASWLLGCVEALPPPATGALLVGHREHPSGILFVERGRVLWVAVGGMSRRLRDILRASSQGPLVDGDLDALYRRCEPERMRAAMKQHTAESLLALDVAQRDAAEWPLTWIGRPPDRGFQAQFSFSATEILAAVGAALVDPVVAEVAGEHLAVATRGGVPALSYVDAPDGAHVVIGEAAVSLMLAESLDLVEWADAALGASGGFSPLVAHACARSAPLGGTVAWRYEGCAFAALCPSREQLHSLVHFVDNQGLPMVLSTSSPALRRIRERGSVRFPDRS